MNENPGYFIYNLKEVLVGTTIVVFPSSHSPSLHNSHTSWFTCGTSAGCSPNILGRHQVGMVADLSGLTIHYMGKQWR